MRLYYRFLAKIFVLCKKSHFTKSFCVKNHTLRKNDENHIQYFDEKNFGNIPQHAASFLLGEMKKEYNKGIELKSLEYPKFSCCNIHLYGLFADDLLLFY